MADLVRKTQFEKICPFIVLNRVMTQLSVDKEKWGDYEIEPLIGMMGNMSNVAQVLVTKELIDDTVTKVAAIALLIKIKLSQT